MARLDPTGVSRILSYIKTWVTNALGGKANSSHSHTKSQITDFPTIPSSTSQLTNDSGFLTSHQSLANYVTLNTAQTISGNKTFSGLTKTSGKVGYDPSGNDVNNAIYNMETTAWGPDTANKPSSAYGTLLSLNREVNVHTSPGIGWIAQFGIGTDTRLYLRTKTNIGSDWSGWREFSDIGHTHTKSQITDFPTIPSNTSQLTNDSGYITSSGSCNYANSSGNADTVDGSHAWQMQTLAASGVVHGSNEWLMQCQYNVDGDGYFKLYCGDKSIGTKVDRATNAGYTDWLRTSSHADHLFHTEWDGSYFWTYVTAGDGGYRGVRVERSNSSGYADSAGNSDTLDGIHEYSFLRYRGGTSTSGEGTLWAQIGIKGYYNALPDGLSGVYQWGEVVSLAGGNAKFDIYCSHMSSAGNGLYYRSGWDDDKKAWRRLIDDGNTGNISISGYQVYVG